MTGDKAKLLYGTKGGTPATELANVIKVGAFGKARAKVNSTTLASDFETNDPGTLSLGDVTATVKYSETQETELDGMIDPTGTDPIEFAFRIVTSDGKYVQFDGWLSAMGRGELTKDGLVQNDITIVRTTRETRGTVGA